MAQGLGPVVRYLAGALAAPEPPDAQLLRGFLAERDEAAFEALVRRHGPVVLGVCRRLLRHEQDAEDVFQATFLVLATRASAVRRAASLASWLHGVALRLARKALAGNARRPVCVAELSDQPARADAEPWLWPDLGAVLDEEIARLPEHHRLPLLLCHLEGRTLEEAARALGCPRGTVASRLARARARLARRLARRGLGASVVLVSADCSALPPNLARTTASAAVAWVTGQAGTSARVMALVRTGGKTMLTTRIKVVLAALLVTAVAGAGMGGLSSRSSAGPGEQPAVKERAAPPAKEPKTQRPQLPDKNKPVLRKETRLDEVLGLWADAGEASRSARYPFRCTQNETVFGRTEVFDGQLIRLAPDLLRIDTQHKGKPTQALLFAERKIHFFNYAHRTEVVVARPKDRRFPVAPKERSRSFSESLRALLSWEFLQEAHHSVTYWAYAGYPPRELAVRYKVHLAKEDQWYAYLEISPRARVDWAEFTRMRIVLSRNGYWVRQIWFEHVNGNATTFDFPQAPVPVPREALLQGLPSGWERIELPISLSGNEPMPATKK